MIVETKNANKMVCPMGQACPNTTVRCSGHACMAWRNLNEDEGYCGMCPAEPDIRNDRVKIDFSEDL